MSNANYDAETTKILAEAEALEAMFQSSGWAVADRALTATISALRDVRNIDITREDTTLQLRVNAAIADNLEEWVNDLRGRVNNAIIMKSEPTKDNLITRR